MVKTPYGRNERVRYAVVGLGHVAQSAVLPAFAHASYNSSLHALISGDPEKLEALGQQYDVAVRGGYDDYEQCLREVDAVYLCLPNSQHAEFAVRAAHAGVHILCEKPLGVTRGQCARIIAACRKSGAKVMTAYRLHFERTTVELLERLRDGEIGDLRYFTSALSMQAKPGIRNNAELGGGTLFDLGVYCINAARLVFASEPTQVFAYSVAGDDVERPGVDVSTSAVMHFEGNRLATFVTSFDAADVSTFTVTGTEGHVVVDPAFAYSDPISYEITAHGRTTSRRGRKADQFAPEILYFSDCILQNRDPEPSAADGAQDVRIIQALYESAGRGEPIAVPPYEESERPEITQVASKPPVRSALSVNVDQPHD